MAKVTTWKWFKIYVTKLDYLEALFQDDSRIRYFDNLRLVSEVYYNVNYNLEIVIRENFIFKKHKKTYSLNKRIGIIYNNIQILNEIMKKSKYNPDSKEEKRAHNILIDQLKRVKKTIRNYFILLENDNSENQENKRQKRNRKEINYKEEELEDDELEEEEQNDPDYEQENEEDKYQEKRDKKYDKKYDKYVYQEEEDQNQEEEYILEIDKNNPNHVRFIYV